METILNYIIKNRNNIIGFILFSLLFIFCALIFVGHQGSVVVDCGREAYIPSAMLKGEMLYKDIFNQYGPLAYQINALIYKFFGESLNSLYMAGLITSISILASIYLISKEFVKSSVAASISLFIMATCVFNIYIFNFIFPYSYSLLYALSAFLLAVLAFLKYIKKDNKNLLLLSLFLMGFSIASKYEFILFAAFLVIYSLFIKPVKKDIWLKGFLAFISMPIAGMGFLFLQGLTIADLMIHIKTINTMVNTESLKFFYSHFTGIYPNKEILYLDFLKFFKITGLLSAISAFFYVCINNIAKPSKKGIVKISKIILFSLLSYFLIFPLYTNFVDFIGYCWLPLSSFLIFIVFGIIPIFYKNSKIAKIQDKVDKDRTFILLALIACLASLKSFFFLNIKIYGSFLLPLTFLVNIIFFATYIPALIKNIDKNIWSKVIAINISIISFFFTIENANYMTQKITYKISTKKGTIYTRDYIGMVHEAAIKYIEQNASKDAYILVIPEGPMINFLTDRKSNGKLNSLIPLHVQAFGEKSIIENLKNNPPDFIILNNRTTKGYGYELFGKDYGQKIYQYIMENYKFEAKYVKKFQMNIYKKK